MQIPYWMMTTPVRWRAYLGDGAYGPQFGELVDDVARVEPRREVVRAPDGTEVVATGWAALRWNDVLVAQSVITIEGTEYQIIRTAPLYGPSGEHHHMEVWFR